MTVAAFVAALVDVAARLGKVTSAAKARTLVPEINALAALAPDVVPPIAERRTPNRERRVADSLQLRPHMRTTARRGGVRAALTPVNPVGTILTVTSNIPANFAPAATHQITLTLQTTTGSTITGRPVTYASSDTGKATVSGSGLVTAVADGTAVITVTSEGISKAVTYVVTTPQQTVVSVTVAPTSGNVTTIGQLVLTATAWSGASGTGNQLTGKTFTAVSSAPSKATVSVSSNQITVTGVAAGTTNVTVTCETVDATAVVITVTAATVGTWRGNEPAGYTQIGDETWATWASPPSTPDSAGWWMWTGFSNVTTVTAASQSAPRSTDKVLQLKWPSGHPGGGGPFGIANTPGVKYKRYYQCFYAKMLSGFTNNGNTGTKWGFGQESDINGDDHWYSNLFNTIGVNIEGSVGNRNMDATFDWSANFNTWHLFEYLFIANTQGAADGTVKLWVDGVLDATLNLTNVKYFGDARANTGWDDFNIVGTYGGGTNPAPLDMFVYLDGYYTSGKTT